MNKNIFSIYLPKTQINEILKNNHGHPLNGHFGFNITYDKIRKKYYWPNMYIDIKEFVKNCHNCQINKLSRKQKPGFCELIEVKSPFSRTEIDITGPFEQTPRGK